MSRQRWRDFICSPRRAGRHLSPIGKSLIGDQGDAIDNTTLGDFLQRLAGADEDVRLLANVVDLATGDYLAFVRSSLQTVLDHLSNEMRHVENVVGPSVRGNVRWDKTLVQRVSGQLPPGRFISRLPHRSFGLQENLLLKWLVGDLLEAVADIERRVGSQALMSSLGSIKTKCEAAISHHWFADVPSPRALTPTMLVAARRHRRPEYRTAARLAEERFILGRGRDETRWQAILSLLSVNWLAPISDDDLFELYALVLVLDILGEDLGLGEPEEYQIIALAEKHIAAFQTPRGRVKVYFDRSPVTFLPTLATRYASTLSSHSGVAGNSRRPDIAIAFSPPGEPTRVLLIEVKKTADGRYMSDSVYKVFGYLHDFQGLWADLEVTKAVLLFPGGVRPIGALPLRERELVCLSADHRDLLVEIIGQFIGA